MSLLALVDGELERASPATRGRCPGCGGDMLAKCGQLVHWHWAHVASKGCDPWRLGETDWHLSMKARFLNLGARVEVPIRHSDKLHIADVVLPAGDVVELAGVYPPASQIVEREAYYGRMRWIYNANKFIERVHEYRKNDEYRFRFKQPAQCMTMHRRPFYWHVTLDEDGGAVADAVCELLWVRQYGDSAVEHRVTYGAHRGWRPMGDLLAELTLEPLPGDVPVA